MNAKTFVDRVWSSDALRRLINRASFDRGRSVRLLATLHTAFSLVYCAPVPSDPAARAEFERVDDPAEPTNRTIFAANKFVDDHALQPIARGYQEYVPDAARRSIHNFVGNLAQPEIAINDVLQGNIYRAWNTTERFEVNTTIGVAGFFDVASDWDLPGHAADFGQTLGVWGIGTGPAVQLPLLGPSDTRDAVGSLVNIAINPIGFTTSGVASTVIAASGGLRVVDMRASRLSATDALEKSSVDYYAALRSAAARRRARLVAEGKQGAVSSASEDAGQ